MDSLCGKHFEAYNGVEGSDEDKIGCHMKFPIFVKYFEINSNCSGVSFVEMGKVGLRFRVEK